MRTMFQIMSGVAKGLDATPEEIKTINPFVWCRFLSGSPVLLPYAIMFNNSDIPMDLQYKTVKAICKSRNIKFIPYPKTIKDEVQNVEDLQKFFKINAEKAREYLTLIDKEELKAIRDIYKK